MFESAQNAPRLAVTVVFPGPPLVEMTDADFTEEEFLKQSRLQWLQQQRAAVGEGSSAHPLTCNLLDHRRKLARSSNSNPAAVIVVQGDQVILDLNGLDSGLECPPSQLSIVALTANQIHFRSTLGPNNLPP